MAISKEDKRYRIKIEQIYYEIYMNHAADFAEKGNVDNTLIFLDLAEDFLNPSFRDSYERKKKLTLSYAYQKGIPFCLDRIEDMLAGKESEPKVKEKFKDLRRRNIRSLLDDAREYQKKIANPDSFKERIRDVEKAVSRQLRKIKR